MTTSELKVQIGMDIVVQKTRIMKYVPGTGVTEIQPFLLLDVSGSMGLCIEGKRKIDMLREAVSGIQGHRQFVFGSEISESTWIPEPQDNTNLAGAFRYLKSFSPKQLLLVSDGQPDSEEDALCSGKNMRIPIDILYIGELGSSGERFMIRLAERTGGKIKTINTVHEYEFQTKLTENIKQLLYGE